MKADPLPQLRKLCLALPEATEKIAWGEPTFRVRDKIFAMGGPDGMHVSIKASIDRQADLIALDAETFVPAAYVGRFGWVTVDLARVDEPLLEDLLRDAWRRTAPKKLAATLAP